MKRALFSTISICLSAFIANAQTQLSNGGFENWETLNGPISNTYEEPMDWNSSNECTAIVNQFSISKSTDAQEGAYSVRLETKSTSFQGIIANGVITTAEMICLAQGGGQEGGSPYTDVLPDSIVGWFKCTPEVGDSAYSQIMFLANNDMDTVSYTRLDFHATPSWTRFSAPIMPPSGNPEKLSLLFSSSWGDGSQGQAVAGSVLWIDNVEFVFPFDIGVGDELNTDQWSVYPNPVQDKVQIRMVQGVEANMEVLDITGKRVEYVRLNKQQSSVDLSALVAGVYLYQIRSSDDQILRTGKLLVNP